VPFATRRLTHIRLPVDGTFVRRIYPPVQIRNDELDRSVPTDLPVRLVNAAEAGDQAAQEELEQLRALRRASAIHSGERLRGVQADRIVVDEVAEIRSHEEMVALFGQPSPQNPWSQVGGITRENLAEAFRLLPQVDLRTPPMVSRRELIEIERDSRTGTVVGLVASGAYELQDDQGRRFHLDANGQAVYHPVHDGEGVHL
jgi:hypothetical protein